MKPTIQGKYLVFNMRKPFGGNSNLYAIRDIFIYKAKRLGKLLKIVTPLGTTIMSPTKFLDGAERIEMYYANPNIPMVMYRRALVPDSKVPDDYFVQDYSPTTSIMERLKEVWIERGYAK
jgi:hypothetical protein